MVPMIFSLLKFTVFSVLIGLISKVRKTQHQNPEFGHTEGEIQKKPAKKKLGIQRCETQKTINFHLSFLFPRRLHCCYIYFHCSYL